MDPNAQTTIDFYNHSDESNRLKNDIGPLEQARTQELIRRYLPPPPAVVVDMGGATGVYSFWLAGSGYTVHLADLTPRHIEQARQASQVPGSPQLASLRVADARQTDFPSDFADAILLHGPLYHLPDPGDRQQALTEARRILRPGGLLLAFAITRYAGLIYGLRQGYIFDADYRRMICSEVRTGLRQDPPAWATTFPNAYFHHPDELCSELTAAGLEYLGTLGILGPAWLVPDLDQNWQIPEQREAILEIARLTENEPVLGPRLLAVGRKV